MNRTNERTNEEKLDLFADLLEPVTAILAGPEVSDAWKHQSRIAAIRMAIKAHKREITEALALIEGEPPETYRIDAMRMILKLLALLNRPDVEEMADGLFTLRDQIAASAPSGPAMGNTGDAAR